MTLAFDRLPTGRRVFANRVNVGTPEKLQAIALDLGFYYNGPKGEKIGAVGQLMDAIAEGDFQVGS